MIWTICKILIDVENVRELLGLKNRMLSLVIVELKGELVKIREGILFELRGLEIRNIFVKTLNCRFDERLSGWKS